MDSKTFLPAVIPVMTVLAPVIAPMIQDWIASNPGLSSIVAALAMLISHLAPSPLKRK